MKEIHLSSAQNVGLPQLEWGPASIPGVCPCALGLFWNLIPGMACALPTGCGLFGERSMRARVSCPLRGGIHATTEPQLASDELTELAV
eukprot:7376605-Prymnesium_polylepis.1